MCWQDGGEVPRQEFEDAVNGMIGDAFENVAKVEFRVEAVELGCTEQGINRSSTFSASIVLAKGTPVFCPSSPWQTMQ
jgi:hypothetical protein